MRSIDQGTGGQLQTVALISHQTVMITIPDTLYGALTISIVDFILSFAIISGIGVVLAFLPLVNRRWKVDEAKLRDGR